MRLCVVSFKECWQDTESRWVSSGGFPLQMAAIGSLFDELTLVVVGGPPREGSIALPAQADVVSLRALPAPGLRRRTFLLRHLGHYLSVIGRSVREADVVHVPLPGDIPLLGMIVAVALRKRLIVRYCGSWARSRRTTVTQRVIKAGMRLLAAGKNVMLATGEAAHPPARAMHWIFATAVSRSEYDGVRPGVDRPLADPPRLACVARLSPEKGVAVLVDAIALLRREGVAPLPRVTLIGDGPERKILEARVAAVGCGGLITFAGQLTRAELSAHLDHADLCVQPSLTEGFSKAWLDAMAHGVPVLASEVGAAPAVIGRAGERGWLVPPGDAPALAATLGEILSGRTDWPALRRRCRRYVAGRTLERWAEEIGQICARRWGMTLAGGRLRA